MNSNDGYRQKADKHEHVDQDKTIVVGNNPTHEGINVDIPDPGDSTRANIGTDKAECADTSAKQKSRSARTRDMLIFREINNEKLPAILPPTCNLIFPNPNELHQFRIKVVPVEGYWKEGAFLFDVDVPEGYNFEPPRVKCATKIWHPNITEDGKVCLSILRSGHIDETGWNPARSLKDVVLGINSLFTDLVNFQDPLNTEAAEMFEQDRVSFLAKVNAYIRDFAQKDNP